MALIDVIIPTIQGREDSLGHCIGTYRATCPREHTLRFGIVRDSPTCGHAWALGAAGLHGINDARVRILGDTAQPADYIHFTADDLLPCAGWLEAAIEAVEHGAIPAPVLECPEPGCSGAGSHGGAYLPVERTRDWYACSSTDIPFYPAKAILDVGLIAPIHYFSDQLVSTRLRRAGWDIRVRLAYRFAHVRHWVGRAAMEARFTQDLATFKAQTARADGVAGSRVLITGAHGFIGQHLRAELWAWGHTVIGIDTCDGDLLDLGVAEQLIAAHRPDVVVHLAARVGRLFGEDDHARTINDNALMTTYVALAAAKVGARLVYGSTSEVYGDQGSERVYEAGPTVLPHNLYGLSKRWGEEACRLYAPEGLQILRLSMPYGPGLPVGRGRAAIMNMIWQAATRQEIIVHRGATRRWCWIGDTVRGIRTVLEQGAEGVYNIGRDDNEVTMLEVAKMACALTGAPETLIREVDPPARQTTIKRLDVTRLRSLGWAPRVELAEGMRRVYPAARHEEPDA